ncbi:DNA-binding CsgD family transcriptional regulator [Amycolatopsis bartoniae]|uniref:Helix-turn-helix transcriptional regulator n=1 Tax=Amycolatopsis bartoniae TaxID=941986 RepID=A0A8H9IVY9_9PSEU|nr:LuxR C-terminal-related transcriptional regulator [Amycolatopsis bartoniae]MBB2937681.1 DNA-binding CsgD family transcriptional regulator [Amycolatopsis bartoniae]GHF39879.1 helix-turn-helix transcriptional regulator [Amycolatopsis bartoniae]
MSAPLHGRHAEVARLTALVQAVRRGRGGALVLTGARGTGKSALLTAAEEAAGELRVLRLAGIAAEAGLPGAGLERLTGGRPDDLLGALGEPVLVLVDDAHRLDSASLDALAFAARRCAHRAAGFVFAVPPGGNEPLAGLPEVPLSALSDEDADQLVGDFEPAVRTTLVASAAGNPADLLALAGALTPAQLAGRQPLPRALPLGRQRTRLAEELAALSPGARRLVLIACCDTVLDVRVLAHCDESALSECLRSEFVLVSGDEVRAVSPAVRATVYADATEDDRRAAHRALAGALDRHCHRAQWIWHRARAAGEPGPGIAAELAAAAAREAPGRAAEALHRAADLTPPGEAKADRLLAAAARYWAAGSAFPARGLLRQAREHAGTEAQTGRILVLQGEIELRDGVPALAYHELSLAAEHLPAEEAAVALLLAEEARSAAGQQPDPQVPPWPAVPLMAAYFSGMAETFRGNLATGREALRQVLAEGGASRDVRSALWAGEAAMVLGEPQLAHDRACAAVSRSRIAADDTLLPAALAQLALTAALLDRPRMALAAAVRGVSAAQAAGQRNSEADHLVLAALASASLGDREAALARLDQAAPRIEAAGLGRAAAVAQWVRACLDLLDDQPEDALRRLVPLLGGEAARPMLRVAAAPQLVEAAIRCGQRAPAEAALDRYECWARETGTASWQALAARCRALLAEDFAVAERHFQAALDLHRTGGATLELARTELLYARRLRRERRTREARAQLRDALRLVQACGADYWTERVRTELRAAGDSAARQATPSVQGLTPQQEQIARLVAAGETNREIASRLMLSQRTVEHHLRNIFVRLNLRSRVELAGALTRAGLAR